MRILVAIYLLVGSSCFGQEYDGPIKPPTVDIRDVSFSADSANSKIYVDSFNNKIYKAHINTSHNYYVKMGRVLDSLKNKGNFQLFVYTQNNELVFKFSGNYKKGKYTKYYPSGVLYGSGKIRNGEHYGYYREYDSKGDLSVKCFYEGRYVRIKGKRFYRRYGEEILCDKKWFKDVNYNECSFYLGTPYFYFLAFSEE